jgi:hypothetical protein
LEGEGGLPSQVWPDKEEGVRVGVAIRRESWVLARHLHGCLGGSGWWQLVACGKTNAY